MNVNMLHMDNSTPIPFLSEMRKININDLYSSKDTWQDTIRSKAQKDGIGITLYHQYKQNATSLSSMNEQSLIQNILPHFRSIPSNIPL